MFYGLLADGAAQSILEYIWDNFWSIIAYVIPAVSVAAAFVVGLVKGFSKRKFFKILAQEVCGQKSIKKENNKNGYDLFYRFRHYTPHKFSNRKGGEDERGISYRQFCKKAAAHNKIVIFAPSGTGKSLLMQKLAYKWRKKVLKKGAGKTLKSYNVLFYVANNVGTVEDLVKKISNDIAENKDVKYSVFIDGFDELAQLSGRSGDELFNEFLNRIESNENGIIISNACKRIVVSMRPEIITEGFAVKEIFDDYDIQLWDIDRFTAKQTLKMYKNESRLSRENRSVRKQNVKKLQAYFNSKSVGDNSVFSYPFIITWLPEVFKDIPQEEIENYSLYDILDIIVANDCRREYKIINKVGMQNQSAYGQFSAPFYAFIKSAALYMCENNSSQITAEEVVSLRTEAEVQGAGDTALLSHRLLTCNDGAPVTYQFIHNLIYWYLLAEAVADVNFERSKRVEILKRDTTLADFYHRAIWKKYNGCFSFYADKSEFTSAVDSKKIRCYSIDGVNIDSEEKDSSVKPTITHEQVLSLLHGFDYIALDDIEYTLGGTVLKKYPVNKGKLSYTVPASVEEILEFAFNGVSDLKNLTIAGNVKKINENILRGCNSVKTVTIGYNVEKIEKFAFQSASSLENVIIEKGKSTIREGAFFKCSALESIKISDSDTTIEQTAFGQCTALKRIEIEKGKTTIGKGAFFECSALESVKISDSDTTIEQAAFGQCTALKRIEIEKGKTIIGECAFLLCSALESIKISDSETTIKKKAFVKSVGLKRIEIEKGKTTIGKDAFFECSALESIKISDSETTIEKEAFVKSVGLKRIEIEKGKTTIGEGSFVNCFALESIKISDSDTTIEQATFGQCTALKRIEIKKGKTIIGEGAFVKCSALESIKISDSDTTIEQVAFGQCTALKRIEICKGKTTIGKGAFVKCSALESIKISDNDTIIKAFAFRQCIGLKRIEIDKGKTIIGGGAFAVCSALESIYLLDNSVTVENSAFLVCTKLKKVIIGKGVNTIGSGAFSLCNSLAEVYYRGSKEDWNNISIDKGNESLLNAERYYYSESEPDFSDGKYWHYGENGEILIWSESTTDNVNS